MTTTVSSFIPARIATANHKTLLNIASVLLGTLIIAAVAQVSIALPYTPVPITGQTFGVALISLLWGAKRGVSAVLLYLTLGFLGAPLFAFGSAGLSFGPTSGYLLGMLLASYVMGLFADKGWTKSFGQTWFAAFCGSLVTFGMGTLVLSFFMPLESLLVAGVLPFLPGDLFKTLLACGIVRQVERG